MCQQCYKEEIDQSILRTKIVETFSLEELRTLCADLKQTLRVQLSLDLLQGEGLEAKVLSLVVFFANRKMLPNLVEEVCNQRTQFKHDHFFLKSQAKNATSAHQSVGASSADRLLTPQHFDLDKLVDIFLDTVRESQGVVGFAIPCDYSEFHKIFCRRIKDEFSRLEEFEGNVDMRGLFKLEYLSIDQLMSKIRNIKDQNPYRYITIPIKLDKSNTETPMLFWQKAYGEFHMLTDHVVIIILTGRTDCTFPECMTKLTPLFTEEDIQRWQLRVGALLKWPPHTIKERWKAQMLQECAWEDGLDMESIYDHMNMVKNILQTYPRLSFEDFFDQLAYQLGEENIYS